MGLFNKKEKKEEKSEGIPSLPELPRLPELPEFPETENYSNSRPSQLPNFSSEYKGDKFSQFSIKNAVTGKKEVEEDADDFAIKEEMQMMQNPPLKVQKEFYSTPEKIKVKEAEPLFIRIDKFEEGSKAFEEVKKQILAIERLFNDLKKVKENEDNEIKTFETEIKQIKNKLDGIDNNIFSKIE